MRNIKKIIWLLLLHQLYMCTPYDQGKDEGRIVVDMAGRQVKVPQHVKKIFSVNPNGTILIYTVNPELLLGWNYPLPAEAAAYIPRKYTQLPHYGQLFGKSTSASEEEILQQAPDIIVCMWPLETRMLHAMTRLQQRLHIPVIVLDNKLERLPEAYTVFGNITGEQERVKVLADYSSAILAKAKSVVAREERRPEIYYGFSGDGLTTISNSSIYMDVFRLCGLRVINGEERTQKSSRIKMQMEQLLKENPMTIILGDNTRRQNIVKQLMKDKKWQPLQAVKRQRIYAVPNGPFNWLDKPPSVNRLAGILWLLWLLYPEIEDNVFTENLKTYYKEFYHIRIEVRTKRKVLEITPL